MRLLDDEFTARWMGDLLREWHPDEMTNLPAESRIEVLDKAIVRGREMGLRYSEDILRLARVRLLLGSGFEQDPAMEWTREYLDDWDPDVGGRLVRLEAEMLRRRKGGGAG